MQRVYNKGDLKELLGEIIERGYDINYASVMASDFFFEENPNVKFSSDFKKEYGLIMDFFLHSPTDEEYRKNFKRVLDDLVVDLNEGDLDKEHLIYILFKDQIKNLEHLYKEKKITPSVFKRQVLKLGNGDFDFDRFIAAYFGK